MGLTEIEREVVGWIGLRWIIICGPVVESCVATDETISTKCRESFGQLNAY